jgi:hypothetical protein
MAQDVQRWENQNFAVTVYRVGSDRFPFTIEAINIDKPHQRASIPMSSLFGMRGKILKFYIDECIKIYHKDQAEDDAPDSQFGFGGVIDHIGVSCVPEAFRKKMNTTKLFANWTYENEKENQVEDTKLVWYEPSSLDIGEAPM